MNKFEQAPHESAEQKNPYLETRDKYKDGASELQQKVGEIQGAKWETSIYRLMERSGDNIELTNALNSFLIALEKRAVRGVESDQLKAVEIEALTKFFTEKSKELEFLTGNQPSPGK